MNYFYGNFLGLELNREIPINANQLISFNPTFLFQNIISILKSWINLSPVNLILNEKFTGMQSSKGFLQSYASSAVLCEFTNKLHNSHNSIEFY